MEKVLKAFDHINIELNELAAKAFPFLEEPANKALLIAVTITVLIAAVFCVKKFLLPNKISPSNKEKLSQASHLTVDHEATQTPKAQHTTKSDTPTDDPKIPQQSWSEKLRLGLGKTRENLIEGLSGLFAFGNLNEEMLEQVHEVLYRADIGVSTADKLVSNLRAELPKIGTDWEHAQVQLKSKIRQILEEADIPENDSSEGPRIILIIGVNGVGKTTSIGKLGAQFKREGKTVALCAADTFRAAAIEQLQIWGKRIDAEVIAHQQGSDPAAVAWDAVQAAKTREVDVLLIDTAGRPHNKQELMDELNKIRRVISKGFDQAPHEVWLVVDATTGQNAAMQVKAFKEVAELTGLIVTKLDGTAKGGVIIGICDKYKLPVRYIGVGEQADDLRHFAASDFADSLF